jgi:hypothetical protein
LVAGAEIRDTESGLNLNGRLSELSRQGCYIDILSTLPKGTVVELRFSRDRGTFTTPARVMYAQDSMGMGFAFIDTPPDQLTILDEWLAELRSSAPPLPIAPPSRA